MQSMTGYGFYETHQGDYHLQAEVKTVNNRYQETRIHLQMPSNRWEILLLKQVKERIRRGRVDLHLFCNREPVSYLVTPELELAREYLNAWRDLYEGLGIKEKISPEQLLKKDELFQVERLDNQDEELEALMRETVNGALDNLLIMRKEEGERLKGEILQAIQQLERILEEMKVRVPLVIEAYRKRLSQRMDQLVHGSEDDLDGERLAFEVAALAEKSDITEELARIQSHLCQLQETLALTDVPMGRKVDFIAQELHREANTIAAKAMDIEIINGAIDMKNHIDGLREQAKNIE